MQNSNEEIIRVSYGSTFSTTPTPEPKENRLLSRFWLSVSWLWLNLPKLTLVVTAFLAVSVVMNELKRSRVVVEEITLPKQLEEMGYSGEVAAYRLWDSVARINDLAPTHKGRTSLVAESRLPEIADTRSYIGLIDLTTSIREVLGIPQTRVAGDFVCRTPECSFSEIELRLRVFQDDRMYVANVGEIETVETDRDLDGYFHKAALDLLRIVDPYVVAFYYRSSERQSGDALPVAKSQSYKEAIRLVQASHPDAAWAAVLIGSLERHRDNHVAAIEWFRKARSLAEKQDINDFALPEHGTALSYESLGEFENAIKELERATQIDKSFSPAWFDYGRLLAQVNQFEDSARKLKTTIDIDPSHAEAYIRLGVVEFALGNQESAFARYAVAADLETDMTKLKNAWLTSINDSLDHDNYDCTVLSNAIAKYAIYWPADEINAPLSC